MTPQLPFFRKLQPRYLTLTLTDDLDFVTKKGFTPRNTYVKYERSITYHSKAMANVKVFCRQTNGQTDRQNKRTGQKLYAPNLVMLGHKNVMRVLKNFRLSMTFTLSQTILGFYDPGQRGLYKCCGKGENADNQYFILFGPNVFLPITERNHHFSKI